MKLNTIPDAMLLVKDLQLNGSKDCLKAAKRIKKNPYRFLADPKKAETLKLLER